MERIIVVRGGGDIATGTIVRLFNAGYRVVVLETDKPTAIRRQVSLCEAIYNETVTVEGVTALYVKDIEDIQKVLDDKKVPVLVDSKGELIQKIKPDILVDAILAKYNIGTNKTLAPFTIALGPGFTAPDDVDAIIETQRGHNLGRIITQGQAIKNTGIPGEIKGYSKERVIHSPDNGKITHIKNIGDVVKKGEVISYIENKDGKTQVKATIDGLLRGLIRENFCVKKGLKIADIDPRLDEYKNCFTISDKARCIAGSVLELVCKFYSEKEGKNGKTI